jgi:hypothetical protein
MTVIAPMEIIVLPETTYFVTTDTHVSVRRIYTDGPNWPDQIEPSFLGYSIGHWIDEVDRLLHHGHLLKFEGKSWRMKEASSRLAKAAKEE